MSKICRIKFKVRGVKGRGQGSAYDMLRYDACFPDTESDAHRLTNYDNCTANDRPIVALCSDDREQRWLPNIKRWESFGYEVIEVSIMDTSVGVAKRITFRSEGYKAELRDLERTK